MREVGNYLTALSRTLRLGLLLTLVLGLASSEFGANPTVDQDHVLTLRLGSNTRSAGFNVEAGTVGAYIPGAYQRFLAASGAARNVTPKSILTGTLRPGIQHNSRLWTALCSAYNDWALEKWVRPYEYFKGSIFVAAQDPEA